MPTLITGGTGTLGRAIAKRLLADGETVRLYSRDEAKHAAARLELGGDSRLRSLVGDVRDRRRLTRAMMGCQTVIHAAAMKRVDACERDPDEAIATNVLGTQNVVAAALSALPRRVVFVSSDKACDPINTYGSTKLAGERLIQNASSYAGGPTPKFVGVRYGNVLGSRGSVVESWRREHALTGRVTVTEPLATRFWITMGEAVDLVLTAAMDAHPGDIVIPSLKASTLHELAGAMFGGRTLHFNIVGLGPGEKMHETLLSAHELRRCVHFEPGLLALTPIIRHTDAPEESRQPVRRDLRYTSDAVPRYPLDRLRAVMEAL